jgi:hypothetical protein
MNRIIILLSIAFIATFSMTASAGTVTDPTGDVYHWASSASGWSWQYDIGNKPNIDIVQLSTEINGDSMIISFKVQGSIQNSERIGYSAYYNTTDTHYWMYWSNGTGMGMASKEDGSGGSFATEDDFDITDNTISVTFDAIGDATTVNMYGYATEYTEVNDISGEWWGDWIPNDQSPYTNSVDDTDPSEDDDTDPSEDDEDTGNTTTNPPGTPGFEFIFLIAAIGLLFIALRKRR